MRFRQPNLTRMPQSRLFVTALAQASGIVAYVAGVALIMTNAEDLFAYMPGVLPAMAFLLLFVISAASTSLLFAGRSVLLYLEGAKRDAVQLLMTTLGALVIITLLIFITMLAWQYATAIRWS